MGKPNGQELFNIIDNIECGEYRKISSWAIWKDPQDAEDYINNIDDFFTDESIKRQMKGDYIFVGLNPTVIPKVDWGGFHKGKNDYKLRYALLKTKYWGSYITDLYSKEETDANKVLDSLNDDDRVNALLRIKRIRDEIHTNAIIIAMGNDVYNEMMSNKRILGDSVKVKKITHFSTPFITYEDYRLRILTQLGSYSLISNDDLLSICKTIRRLSSCDACPLDNDRCFKHNIILNNKRQ